ncbi:BQ5605_C014g07462 [Microbotryum silenes-dioicae]|uniref:BQ5605_C014g07462 protein n=1 Tax=Microbotryum silenes-dioicae TaxID=796604 RepID=A0A2X0LY87_9BASI|nr:BQ5605_C014g07462 [Microbotryum silenes-dioicae]
MMSKIGNFGGFYLRASSWAFGGPRAGGQCRFSPQNVQSIYAPQKIALELLQMLQNISKNRENAVRTFFARAESAEPARVSAGSVLLGRGLLTCTCCLPC